MFILSLLDIMADFAHKLKIPRLDLGHVMTRVIKGRSFYGTDKHKMARI